MSAAWLAVPTPQGDLADMEWAAATLARLAQDAQAEADRLVRIGVLATHEWEGEAAEAFVRRQAAARRAVESIALAQDRVAAEVRGYAEEWGRAQQAAHRARTDISGALSSYAGGATAALDHVVALLRSALDNPVADLLGHLVPAADHVIDRLLSWQPPAAHPFLSPVGVAPLAALTESRVLGELHAVGDWAVSRLLDGIEAVADLVGGVIEEAFDLLHGVEQALVRAVTAAQAAVTRALQALFDLGVRTAQTIARIVTEVATEVFEATVELVEDGVDFLVQVGRDLVAAAYLAYEVGAALVGVALILDRLRRGEGLISGGRRRLDGADAADLAAYVRWRKDDAWRRQVVDLADLAGDSYRDGGAPEGWERVETLTGPEGAVAVLYRDPSGRLVVAFRGSEAGENFDVRDWSQDSLNAADLPTAQGLWAIRLAQRLASEHPGVTFTGHSLGGSLASLASITTGAPAITFNSAGVGGGNHIAAMAAGAGAGASEQQITNFHTTNDILTLLQEHLPMYSAAGAQVTLASNTGNPGDAHGLGAFEEFDDVRRHRERVR